MTPLYLTCQQLFFFNLVEPGHGFRCWWTRQQLSDLGIFCRPCFKIRDKWKELVVGVLQNYSILKWAGPDMSIGLFNLDQNI